MEADSNNTSTGCTNHGGNGGGNRNGVGGVGGVDRCVV